MVCIAGQKHEPDCCQGITKSILWRRSSSFIAECLAPHSSWAKPWPSMNFGMKLVGQAKSPEVYPVFEMLWGSALHLSKIHRPTKTLTHHAAAAVVWTHSWATQRCGATQHRQKSSSRWEETHAACHGEERPTRKKMCLKKSLVQSCFDTHRWHGSDGSIQRSCNVLVCCSGGISLASGHRPQRKALHRRIISDGWQLPHMRFVHARQLQAAGQAIRWYHILSYLYYVTLCMSLYCMLLHCIVYCPASF